MSEPFVECPICEATFQQPADPGESNRLTCPHCQQTFVRSLSIPLEGDFKDRLAVRPAPEAQVTFDPSAPVRLDFQTSSPSPSPSPTLNSNPNLLLPPSLVPNSPSTPTFPPELKTSASLIQRKIQRRKKTQNRVFLTALFGLFLLTLLFAGLIVRQLNNDPSQAASNPPSHTELTQTEANETNPRNTSSDFGLVPRSDKQSLPPTDPISTAANQPSLVPPPEPKFFFFDREQSAEIWKSAKPHLLNLKIEGPLGTQTATATLVDSRGWALTSYQAIKDAWKIEVSAATPPLDQPSPTDPLTDLARGIVAFDSDHDLALLSVNRRFVVSFANITLSKHQHTVAGEFFLQCNPPTLKNFYGISEVKISAKGSAAELPERIQAKVNALSLNAPDFKWLTVSGTLGANPGTPLFDREGKLQAMVSFTKQEFAYAVFVNQVTSLIATADDQNIQPLQMPVITTNDGETLVLDTNSIAAKMVRELHASAALVQEFDWLPSSLEQYTQLQDFSTALVVGQDYLAQHPPQADDSANVIADRQSVDNAVQQWKDVLFAKIEIAKTQRPELLERMNELALELIQTPKPTKVVFFGSLFIGPASSRRPILKFSNSDNYLNIDEVPADPVMLPDSQWFFVVQTLPRSKRMVLKLNDDQTIDSVTTDLLFVVGPFQD